MVVMPLSTFGWVLVVCAFVCIWVALAFWPARVADRKGHSFLGYFILSLFFFPLALIMAYMVHDRHEHGGLATS
jgi:amino acid transporter